MLKKLALIGLTMSIAFATGVGANPALAPSVSTPVAANKTVVITARTTGVKVHENDTVLFRVGDKSFAVNFNGHDVVYNLQTLAPKGVLTHNVKVFVSPNPRNG